MNVIKFGESEFQTLRKKCIDVRRDNPILQALIQDMFETVIHFKGVGLAAPQVGRSLNMFVVNLPDFKEVMINPEIKPFGDHLQVREGCLSFPNIETPTNRKSKVAVRYFDRNWTQHTEDYEGILAIVIQHEYDHLQGKLIIDF